MTKGIICDRCGKAQPDHGSGAIEKRIEFEGWFGRSTMCVSGFSRHVQIDLCEECQEDFERWMKGDGDAD